MEDNQFRQIASESARIKLQIVLFLKGGQNFITATSPKNLKKVISRFKEQKTLLGEDELWEEE